MIRYLLWPTFFFFVGLLFLDWSFKVHFCIHWLKSCINYYEIFLLYLSKGLLLSHLRLVLFCNKMRFAKLTSSVVTPGIILESSRENFDGNFSSSRHTALHSTLRLFLTSQYVWYLPHLLFISMGCRSGIFQALTFPDSFNYPFQVYLPFIVPNSSC